jgi:hypothetical protein
MTALTKGIKTRELKGQSKAGEDWVGFLWGERRSEGGWLRGGYQACRI